MKTSGDMNFWKWQILHSGRKWLSLINLITVTIQQHFFFFNDWMFSCFNSKTIWSTAIGFLKSHEFDRSLNSNPSNELGRPLVSWHWMTHTHCLFMWNHWGVHCNIYEQNRSWLGIMCFSLPVHFVTWFLFSPFLFLSHSLTLTWAGLFCREKWQLIFVYE